MAIGPDGRIIRRRIRLFTPVNTNNPAENTGFFMGFFSVILVSVLFIAVCMLIGLIGGWIFDLKWWNYKNFFVVGFLLNLLIFPIYISGVLEGLATYNYSRYRYYSFLYGTIGMAFLIAMDSWSKSNFNYWNYLWAGGYGVYCVWVASKMAN